LQVGAHDHLGLTEQTEQQGRNTKVADFTTKDEMVTPSQGEMATGGIGKQNSPPEIKGVRFVPEVFHVGDTLGVVASGFDADKDDVSITYEWRVNGEEAGQTDRLSFPVRRGDQVDVTMVPFDGKDYGRPVTLESKILNCPPMIIPNEEADFDGETYLYQVKAQDPDGDKLTYSLASAPEGMTINPASGLVTWDVPKEYTGLTNVSAIIKDGHGGQAQYDMKVTIKSEQAGNETKPASSKKTL
jgi:hypothetical protein